MQELIRLNTDEVFVTAGRDSNGESAYYISENALVYVASGKIDILIDGKAVANFKESSGACSTLSRNMELS